MSERNSAAVAAGAAAAVARAVAFGLLALLLLVFIVWHAARFSRPTAALLGILAVVPWLPLLSGLHRGRARAQALGLLLTTPYLVYGLTEVLANPGARRYAGATVLLSFALSVVLAACLRLSRVAAARS